MRKDLYVTCPCCENELRIDPKTGEIVSFGKKEQSSGLDFGAALEAEKKRKQELEDLFKQASDKADQKPDFPSDMNDDKWQ